MDCRSSFVKHRPPPHVRNCKQDELKSNTCANRRHRTNAYSKLNESRFDRKDDILISYRCAVRMVSHSFSLFLVDLYSKITIFWQMVNCGRPIWLLFFTARKIKWFGRIFGSGTLGLWNQISEYSSQSLTSKQRCIIILYHRVQVLVPQSQIRFQVPAPILVLVTYCRLISKSTYVHFLCFRENRLRSSKAYCIVYHWWSK
jgi:hypothetical protein